MPNAITNVRSNNNSSGVAARCSSSGSRPDIGECDAPRRCWAWCGSTSLMNCRVCPADRHCPGGQTRGASTKHRRDR